MNDVRCIAGKYNATKDAASRFDMQTLVEKDMVALWRRSWVVLRLPNVNPGYCPEHASNTGVARALPPAC